MPVVLLPKQWVKAIYGDYVRQLVGESLTARAIAGIQGLVVMNPSVVTGAGDFQVRADNICGADQGVLLNMADTTHLASTPLFCCLVDTQGLEDRLEWLLSRWSSMVDKS